MRPDGGGRGRGSGDRSDETDPFARLERTHRRIEERLQSLEEATADLDDPERRAEAMDVIKEVMDFLGSNAKRHHDDEEETLFPRLAALPELAPLVARLAQEHVAHDTVLAELAALLKAPESGPLWSCVRRLGELYRSHIDAEERELFPAVRAALAPAVLEDMGREMQQRRRAR